MSKILMCGFTMHPKEDVDRVANQTLLHQTTPDLGIDCLPRPLCPKTLQMAFSVILFFFSFVKELLKKLKKKKSLKESLCFVMLILKVD